MNFKNFLAESRESYITDFGEPIEAKPEGGGAAINVGRYGVWKYDPAKGKHQVVDSGDDLEELKKKHGNLRVVPIGKGNHSSPNSSDIKPVLPMQRRDK
jgi:hypothetical protein